MRQANTPTIGYALVDLKNEQIYFNETLTESSDPEYYKVAQKMASLEVLFQT